MPSGKIELYSAEMANKGFPALPTYVPLAEDSDLPFMFIPAPNHNFLNSTFAHNEKHVRMEKMPKLHMHEDDASALDLASGDLARVWNERGECELVVMIGRDG